MIFDGTRPNSGLDWYAGRSYIQQSACAHGLTPSENRFLRFSPLFFLTSNLFPAVYLRQRKTLTRQPLETISRSRNLAFSGECLDQADLDILLTCFGQAGENGGMPGNLVRIDFKTIAATLDFRPGKQGRERVLKSVYRLEKARLEIYNSRYRLRLQPVSKLLFDDKKQTCLMELHPIVHETFRRVPGLRVFLQERNALGKNGLAKWLHAVSWANGGRFYMHVSRMRSLSGIASGSRNETLSKLNMALAVLDEHRLLRHMELQGEDGVVLAGTRRDQQCDKCMVFQ